MADKKPTTTPEKAARERFAGVHAAYRLGNGGAARDLVHTDIRTFSARIDALEHALVQDPPMKVVAWPTGMSLTEAIAAAGHTPASVTAPLALASEVREP